MNFFGKLFTALNRRGLLRFISDERCCQILYRIHLGKKLDLKEPRTFSEKLQWLKVYDHDPRYAELVDKYESKQWAARQIGEKHIIPTLGVWDCFDAIDFGALPDAFVLKCTHDSASIVICRDKAHFDAAKARNKLEICLKRNYYWAGREWPYKGIKPRIIAEQYMEDSIVRSVPEITTDGLIDYKFYCFQGEPRFLYAAFANITDNAKADYVSFFDLDWNTPPFGRTDHPAVPFEIPKPERLSEMIDMARKLSAGIPFVRVDLYDLAQTVYFSEMTFYPGSGYGPFSPAEWEKTIGEWIVLPKKRA